MDNDRSRYIYGFRVTNSLNHSRASGRPFASLPAGGTRWKRVRRLKPAHHYADLLNGLRQQVSQADIPQPETDPDYRTEYHGKQHVEPSVAGAHLARNGSPEISGEQNRTD